MFLLVKENSELNAELMDQKKFIEKIEERLKNNIK
jgi:hypothetical protein